MLSCHSSTKAGVPRNQNHHVRKLTNRYVLKHFKLHILLLCIHKHTWSPRTLDFLNQLLWATMWVPVVDRVLWRAASALNHCAIFPAPDFTVEIRLASELEECLWLLGALCFKHEGLLSFMNSGRRHEATASETEDFTTPSIAWTSCSFVSCAPKFWRPHSNGYGTGQHFKIFTLVACKSKPIFLRETSHRM